MSVFLKQSPGIGGLDEITDAEALFLQNLTGLSYSQGDILYHDGSDLVRLAKGSSTEVLTMGATIPGWAASGAGANTKVAIDSVATAGYLGAASNDGVLRTSAPITYADGGDYITLAITQADTTNSGYLTTTDWDTFNDKQSALTFGIADTNKVQINSASVADDDYAKFTATGLEGRSYAEVLSDIGAQASDAALTSISALTYVSGSFIALTANDTYSVRTYAQTLSDIGAQATDASLTSIAGLTYVSASFIKLTAEDTYAVRTLAEVRTDLNVADGATANTKATGAEINTGTDDVKFATSKAIDDSKLKTKMFMVRLLDSDTNQAADTTVGGDYRISPKNAITVTNVGAYCDTAGTTGTFTVDIHEAGTTILSTKITVDTTEKSSETAATAPVISDSAIAADAIVTFDIDGIQTTPAKGLVVWIEYTY